GGGLGGAGSAKCRPTTAAAAAAAKVNVSIRGRRVMVVSPRPGAFGVEGSSRPAVERNRYHGQRADRAPGQCRASEGLAWRLGPHRPLCFRPYSRLIGPSWLNCATRQSRDRRSFISERLLLPRGTKCLHSRRLRVFLSGQLNRRSAGGTIHLEAGARIGPEKWSIPVSRRPARAIRPHGPAHDPRFE